MVNGISVSRFKCDEYNKFIMDILLNNDSLLVNDSILSNLQNKSLLKYGMYKLTENPLVDSVSKYGISNTLDYFFKMSYIQ